MSSLDSFQVGDSVRCFVGRPDQIADPALFYVWRKCRVAEVDNVNHRILVHYDANTGFDDEWIEQNSQRIDKTGKMSVAINNNEINHQHKNNIRHIEPIKPPPLPSHHHSYHHQQQSQQQPKIESRSKSLSDADDKTSASHNTGDAISTPPPSSTANNHEVQSTSHDDNSTPMEPTASVNTDSNDLSNFLNSANSNTIVDDLSVDPTDVTVSVVQPATSPKLTVQSTAPPPPLPSSSPPQPPNIQTKSKSVGPSPNISPRNSPPPLNQTLSSPVSSDSPPRPQSQPPIIESPNEEFQRSLTRGSFVDVWDPAHRTWTCSEVLSINTGADNSVIFTLQTLTTGSKIQVKRGSHKIVAPFTKSSDINPTPPIESPKQQSQTTNNTNNLIVNNNNNIVNNSNNNSSNQISHPNIASPRSNNQSSASSSSSSSNSFVNSSSPLPDPPAGFSVNLSVGDMVDCLDTDKVWRVAEIMQVTQNEVYVHYDGWQKKWDEWIKKDNKRIQPPRTLTTGYTGPTAANVVPIVPVAKPVINRPPAIPAVPVPWSCPPYRPSNLYDCRHECKWRRVLSMGLGHREIQAIDALFTRCCQLQDDYQAMLIAESQPPHAIEIVQQRLKEAKAEIETQSKSLPAFANFYLEQCRAITTTVAAGIGEMADAMKRQELAIQEDIYIEKLANQFNLIRVPADGNCLFTAVGRGHANRIEQLATTENSASPPEFSPPAAPVSQLPRVYRDRAIELLMSEPNFRSLIETELELAVSQEREGRGDPTSKALLRELQNQCGSDSAIDEAIHGDAGVFVYASVMGQDGIYGTSVEVEALSQLLKSPIHIYYRAGVSDDGPISEEKPEIPPTQIIGEQFTGPPICLAYYMGNRHYNLLVKRPPTPKPIPPPLPHSPPPSAQKSTPNINDGSQRHEDADDELMVALLQSERTPNPSLATPGMSRSKSSGQLETISSQSRTPQDKNQSKDELTLLFSTPIKTTKSQISNNSTAESNVSLPLITITSPVESTTVAADLPVSASDSTPVVSSTAAVSIVSTEPTFQSSHSPPVPETQSSQSVNDDESNASNDTVIANTNINVIEQYYPASQSNIANSSADVPVDVVNANNETINAAGSSNEINSNHSDTKSPVDSKNEENDKKPSTADSEEHHQELSSEPVIDHQSQSSSEAQ